MVNLSKIPTGPKSVINKKKTKKKIVQMLDKIQLYQRMMYAQGKYSILLILQGMDAAGKDGAIKDLFSCINPLGCSVTGFKKPTPEEASHDFLWRVHKHAPSKGMIHIFNRSHYEDVLVPPIEGYISRKDLEKRYEDINNFEKLLEDNDTKIVKCYLHIGKQKQKQKLEERLSNPNKYWKHNDNDWESRELWEEYMKEYHIVFDKCSETPRHVIPSDKNRWKVYNLAEKLIEAFESMDLEWPELESDKFTPIEPKEEDEKSSEDSNNDEKNNKEK